MTLRKLLASTCAAALFLSVTAPAALAAYKPDSAAANFTSGTLDGVTIGGKTPGPVTGTIGTFNGPVTSAGEVGATQIVTTTSGTVSSTTLGTNVSFVYVTANGAVALAGPANPVPGDHFTIADGSGAAATNPITYTPGSGITINGQASYPLSCNRCTVNVWIVSATVQAIY